MTNLPRPPRMPQSVKPVTEQHLSAKVPSGMIYDLAQLEKRWGISRSAVVRRLLEEGVRRESLS